MMKTYNTIDSLLQDVDLFAKKQDITPERFVDIVKGSLKLVYKKNNGQLAMRLGISKRQLQEVVAENQPPVNDEGYMRRRLTAMRPDIVDAKPLRFD